MNEKIWLGAFAVLFFETIDDCCLAATLKGTAIGPRLPRAGFHLTVKYHGVKMLPPIGFHPTVTQTQEHAF